MWVVARCHATLQHTDRHDVFFVNVTRTCVKYVTMSTLSARLCWIRRWSSIAACTSAVLNHTRHLQRTRQSTKWSRISSCAWWRYISAASWWFRWFLISSSSSSSSTCHYWSHTAWHLLYDWWVRTLKCHHVIVQEMPIHTPGEYHFIHH